MFLQEWGTHVTLNNLIGGMYETQILFKDCVWTNPNFSEGLSESQLQDYMHNELKEEKVDDS